LAVDALDGQIAAHEAAEMAADGEAQAGPAVLAPGGRFGLGDRLEQPPELRLGNADAGDGEGDRGQVTGNRGCAPVTWRLLSELSARRAPTSSRDPASSALSQATSASRCAIRVSRSSAIPAP
jgi:hypothetical protein